MGSLILTMLLAAQDPGRAGLDFFEKRIRPVLVERCLSCHSAQAKVAKAELTLDSREAMLRGGVSGRAVIPGDSENSLLIKAIRYSDEDLGMPPKVQDRLSPQQISDFVAWINMGAPAPGEPDASAPAAPKIDFEKARTFWSFRPVRDPAPPAVRDASWSRTDVDRFLLAALEARGLRPAPEADRRTLLRRATYDLTGLPPTPGEIAAFLNDARPDAFERVVDRLLASPAYGERWGRHWLDVVRYADTAGDNSDFPVPQAWRYRNWVIRAFQDDKPFAAFVREQLAGDLLPTSGEEARREGIVATGFLAIARRFADSIEKYHHLTLEDAIDTTGQAFLGLSLSCARCHDHKYDPIPSEDYYALYGIFSSTRFPYPGCETTRHQKDVVPLIPPDEADALLKPYRERLAAFEEQLKGIDDELKRLKESSEPAKEKASKELRDRREKLRKERDLFVVAGRPAMETAYAVSEGKPSNARLHVKGDPKREGKEVPRGFLQVLGGARIPDGAAGSGRRELADWLADPANPLVPRVYVNRIWQHHFGRGLVATPNDFGARGLPPTHPELLDWLVARFLEGGGSTKAMHRLILASSAYRLASRGAPELAAADPENALRGRFDRRRLEAEAVRDAMLALGGRLDRSPGGPHPFPAETKWTYSASNPFSPEVATERRSVYVASGRLRRPAFFEAFDGADPNLSTGRRVLTSTPLQPLFLLNDPFVAKQAEGFAARLLAADGDRLALAWESAFARTPASDERRRSSDFLAAVTERLGEPAAWSALCRALFGSSEFQFVD
jgi:hypothetical protein